MDTSATASTAPSILAVLIALILFVIPSVIVFFKLFKAAGQPGWAAIVPVYSSIVMSKIAKKPLWLGVLVGVAGALAWGIRGAAGNDSPIEKIALLVYIVFGLYLLNAFIKKYDRGLGAWVIYVFLPIIGMFIVNKATYKDGTLAAAPAVTPINTPTPQPPVQQPPIQ